MQSFNVHPLATIFPPITGEAFQELAADIAENGLREPITTLDGAILDGRNRASACARVGVELRFEEWKPSHEGDTPQAFVISRNLRRRMLTDGQRAAVAARLVTTSGNGGAVRWDRDKFVTMQQAADALNVNKRQVARARIVLRNGDAETIAAMDNGKMSVTVAAQKATAGRTPRSKKGPPVGATTPQELLNDIRDVRRAATTLPVQISDFIDAIRSRPREVEQIGRERRMELATEFAAALGLIKDSRPGASGMGSAAAAVAAMGS